MMREPNTSAFPQTTETRDRGLTVRDYFAARAMQGMITSDAAGLAQCVSEGKGEIALSNTARLAYAVADAMLEARKR